MTTRAAGNPVLQTVLFDLDGTLVDTAPDLATALNHVLATEGRPAMPLEAIRTSVSHGSKRILQLAFDPDDAHFETLRETLLDYYLAHIADQSLLFAGMASVLDYIEQHDLSWGVVTNKPAWLTEPLLDALHLTQRAACIVSGDTTAYSKPHPEPVLHACRLAGCAPRHSVYIGDDRRDIDAGRAAGTQTLAAAFGYIDPGDDPGQWQADRVIDTPADIITWLAEQQAIR